MQETWVRSLGQEDPLEKGTATHFSTFACHGQRSLVGYSSRGHKVRTTERLTHKHTHTHLEAAKSWKQLRDSHTHTHTHTHTAVESQKRLRLTDTRSTSQGL